MQGGQVGAPTAAPEMSDESSAQRGQGLCRVLLLELCDLLDNPACAGAVTGAVRQVARTARVRATLDRCRASLKDVVDRMHC